MASSGPAVSSATVARMRAVLLTVVLPVLVVVVVAKMVWSVRSGTHFGVVLGRDSIIIQDFAWLLNFAKAFWRGEAGFRIDDYLRITEGLAGQRLPYSFPFLYSPTMFWILGPLCLLPIVWGYVAWALLGLIAVWWMSRRQRSLAVAAVFISPVAMGAWGLGQTAILATVALLALMGWDSEAEHRQAANRRYVIVAAVVVWALTAKPPLAIAAATALLAGRRFSVVAVALGVTVVSTLVLLPRMGATGVADYLFMLRHYDLETAPPAFAWSVVPATMGNVRALLHVTFGIGDAVASRWSAALWLLASAAIVATAARRAMAAEVRWGLAVLAYLLFCPHVSWTEEIALAVVLAGLAAVDPTQVPTQVPTRVPTRVQTPVSPRAVVTAFVLVLLFLLPGIPFQGGVRLPVAVAGKLLIAGWLLARSSANTAQAPSA